MYAGSMTCICMYCVYISLYLYVLIHMYIICRRIDGGVMECQCALIETLFDYCPREGRVWWPSTAHIGTKLLYMPSPEPVVYIVLLSHILGRLPLLPAGEHGTIPRSMSRSKDACFPRGRCDKEGQPGSGSPLYYINSWAMIWPTDYPAAAR